MSTCSKVDTAERALEEALHAGTRDVAEGAVVQAVENLVVVGDHLQRCVQRAALLEVLLDPRLLDELRHLRRRRPVAEEVAVVVPDQGERRLLVRVDDVVGPVDGAELVVALDQEIDPLAGIDLPDVDGDADLRELLLEQHGYLLVDPVARLDRQPERRPGCALGLQHGPGLLRIVGGQRCIAVVVHHAGREERVGRRGVTEGHHVDDGLRIDGQPDRLADVEVVQRRCGVVGQQVIGLAGRIEDHLDVRIRLKLRNAVEGNEESPIQLARLHLEDARVVLRDDVPLDPIDQRQAFLPVVGIALQDDDLAAPPLLEAEGAGADRVAAEFLAPLLDHCLRQNRSREHGEDRQERRRWLVERKHDRAIVRRLDRGDVLVERRLGCKLVVARALDAELGILCRDRRAVGEHGLAQMERVGQAVLGDLPVRGQIGLDVVGVLGRTDQVRVDVVHGPDVEVLDRERRIERLGIGLPAQPKHAFGERRFDHETRRQQECDEEMHGSTQHGLLPFLSVSPWLGAATPARRFKRYRTPGGEATPTPCAPAPSP